MNELISVIMPVYNDATVLERAVNSVLQQSYHPVELILIDDGSNDGTESLCDRLAAENSNICTLHQKNGGAAAARNTGLGKASGRYIAFADADDLLHRDCLMELHKALSEHNVPMSCCEAIDRKPDKVPEQYNWDYLQDPGELLEVDATFDFSDHRSHKVVWGALFKRELLDGLSFDEDLFIGEDTLFVAKAMLRAGSVWYLPEPLYCYVIYDHSQIHGQFSERKLSQLESWRRIGCYYENAHSQYAFTCMHFLKILSRDNTGYEALERQLREEVHVLYPEAMNSHFSGKIKLQFWLLEHYYGLFQAIYKIKEVN